MTRLMTKKKRNELQRQREQRTKELAHFRDWIHSHPQHVHPEVQPAAIDYLNSSIAELDAMGKPQKMKNDRPGRRPQLRTRLRILMLSILTHPFNVGK